MVPMIGPAAADPKTGGIGGFSDGQWTVAGR
jgi:hypothetical protein